MYIAAPSVFRHEGPGDDCHSLDQEKESEREKEGEGKTDHARV